MKKRGERSIPDFSKKQRPAPGAPQPDAGTSGRAPTRPQPVKPQGTTSKSGGRRGS